MWKRCTPPGSLEVRPPRDTRLEIKRVSHELFLPEVRSWLRLHPAGFSASYPPRWIHNIYFDSAELESYMANLDGVSRRRKIRLRWYGDERVRVRGTFEVKCQQNSRGWKLSQRVDRTFDLRALTWREMVRALRGELRPDLRAYLEPSEAPVLLNRYLREYYSSGDGRLTVTLDSRLEMYDQTRSSLPNLDARLPRPECLILEFKMPTRLARECAEAISVLPLRVTRCSKYALGVDHILGY